MTKPIQPGIWDDAIRRFDHQVYLSVLAPCSQLFEVLLEAQGLDYELAGTDLVRIGPRTSLARERADAVERAARCASWIARTPTPPTHGSLTREVRGIAYGCLRMIALASTGCVGLDEILRGGLPRDRIYLVQGDPGVGKTTLAMQFLLEGRARDERCMYIALSETRPEIESVAASHNWSLAGIEVLELSALEQANSLRDDNSLFESADVELQETTRMLLGHIERVTPDRVVFDSLSELRLLAQGALRYRRQILALKQFFADRRSTVLLLDDLTSEPGDQQLQSLAHGVVSLEQATPVYGADRRRLRIAKLRGVRFGGGYHDFAIVTGGLTVFPRVAATTHPHPFEPRVISSGSLELDALLGGGIDYGTSTLLVGPAGTGKSSVALQYAIAAAQRGEPAAVFAFDERIATMTARSRALGIDLDEHISSGHLRAVQIDPAEISAGEFGQCVRDVVEKHGCRVVVIDSLNGYQHAFSDEHVMMVQLHELFSYLANQGVATILVSAQHGLVGPMMASIDVSYVADTVVLLRYFESQGRIRKAISVIKKRSGRHENMIRELTLDERGLRVGEPLEEFAGVLTGVPRYHGSTAGLADREE